MLTTQDLKSIGALMDQKLDSKFGDFERKFDKKLDDRFDDFAILIQKEFVAIHKKFDEVEERLGNKITSVEKRVIALEIFVFQN